MKEALNSLAAGASLHIREPTGILLLMEPIPWAGSRKEKRKYPPSYYLLQQPGKSLNPLVLYWN